MLPPVNEHHDCELELDSPPKDTNRLMCKARPKEFHELTEDLETETPKNIETI